jgi:membrane protease YdiL (CAAX protease family)
MLEPTLACDPVLLRPRPLTQSHPLSLWALWLAVILAIGPFIVRRIMLLGDDNYVHWMAIDYLARCISLIGVVLGFHSGLLQPVHLRTDWLRSLRVFLLLFLAELAEQAFGCPVIEQYFRFMETVSWPPIPDPTLRAVDLSLGLLFAVFVEELVFRKFIFAVVERWLPQQQLPVIIISATIFALIHFTSGVIDTMVNAFVHGIFFGMAYWTTRRLSICVVSHYLIDLLIFSSH